MRLCTLYFFVEGNHRLRKGEQLQRMEYMVEEKSGSGLPRLAMARYHGFIEAPTTNNLELISVEKRTDQKFGAEPYNGPNRPEFK